MRTIASVTNSPSSLQPGWGSVSTAEMKIAATDATAITRMAMGGPCLPGGVRSLNLTPHNGTAHRPFLHGRGG